MNHVPRLDPQAEEVARIRAVVARHALPDFVSGFDVRLWEFDGSPILSIVFRTIDEAGRSVSELKARAGALRRLQAEIQPELLEAAFEGYPHFSSEPADAAEPSTVD